jgi:hypothetical protein
VFPGMTLPHMFETVAETQIVFPCEHNFPRGISWHDRTFYYTSSVKARSLESTHRHNLTKLQKHAVATIAFRFQQEGRDTDDSDTDADADTRRFPGLPWAVDSSCLDPPRLPQPPPPVHFLPASLETMDNGNHGQVH